MPPPLRGPVATTPGTARNSACYCPRGMMPQIASGSETRDPLGGRFRWVLGPSGGPQPAHLRLLGPYHNDHRPRGPGGSVMGVRIRLEFGRIPKCNPWKFVKFLPTLGCRYGLIRRPAGSVLALCPPLKTVSRACAGAGVGFSALEASDLPPERAAL